MPGRSPTALSDADWTGSYVFEVSVTHWAAENLPAADAEDYRWRRDVLRTLGLDD